MNDMAAMTFDTLKASKRLKAVGFGDEQANEIVGTVADAINCNLATKADMLENRNELKLFEQRVAGDFQSLDQRFQTLDQRFQSLDQRITDEIQSLEQRMTIRLGSIMIAGIGFLVILDRLFPVTPPG